jgi:hypothetical protein
MQTQRAVSLIAHITRLLTIPGLFVNKHLFSSTTGTILTMKRGERAADDGDKMSEDERGKFTRRETGRFSLTHYENCYGEAKSDIVKDVARGA